MKKYLMIALLVATAAVVAGCGSTKTLAPTPTPTTPVPTTQSTPAPTSSSPTTTVKGKDVYDKSCASCHGAEGAGASAPTLNNGKTQSNVLNIVKKGKGSMPAYAGQLSDAEIQAVSQYVADLKK